MKLHLSNLLTVLIKSCQACFLCPVPTVRCNSCLYLCSNFLAELKIGFKRCMYSYASLMSQSEYSPWNVAIHFCTFHYKLYKVQFHANSLHFNFKQSWKAGLLNKIYSCKYVSYLPLISKELKRKFGITIFVSMHLKSRND